MYATDSEIVQLLDLLNIVVPSGQPFDANEQIQPCSIDIRLSNVFWRPIKSGTLIDLRKSHLLEISPRRHWKRIDLGDKESITLRPGSFYLCRTHEKFTIPPGFAGKIEGRSSFARLGIQIHCTGDFINPGYRGHMTLQLVNLGPHNIKVFPYLPICQLILIKLDKQPRRLYGHEELGSKYIEDDGGPSYWWRDKRISKLQTVLMRGDLAAEIQDAILSRLRRQEPEVMDRFEKFFGHLSQVQLDNIDTIMDRFAATEDRHRKIDSLKKWVCAVPLAVFGSYAVKLIFDRPHQTFHYVIWVLAAMSLAVAYYGATLNFGQYLGRAELRRLNSSLSEETNF